MILFRIVKFGTPVVIAIITLSIISKTEAWTMDLQRFKWNNRLLFIFAPQSSQSFFIDLHKEITSQRDGVSDRDLVVFEIFETGQSFMDSTQIDSQTAEGIRREFDVPLGRFTVILVGKDGGVKLRVNDPVQLGDIFGLIDAMPMRQQEMRQKAQ
jgi:hypothetical protein